MIRFGSSRFRITLTCTALLFAGLVIVGLKFTESVNLSVFGAQIPLSALSMLTDPQIVFRGGLVNFIYVSVPVVILLTSFFPAHQILESGQPKKLAKATTLAALNGVFFSQVLLLPIWAANFKLLGTTLSAPLLMANLNATVLGFQLLFWALIASQIIKSNPGFAILIALALRILGGYFAWGGEFMSDPDLFRLPAILVKGLAFMGKLLPTAQEPTEPFLWTTLLIGLGGPIFLLTIRMLLSRDKVVQQPSAAL